MLDVSFHEFFGQDELATPQEYLNSITFGQKYMATGDASGRIVLFAEEKTESQLSAKPSGLQPRFADEERINALKAKFAPVAQYQAHYDEFDAVRGVEVFSAVRALKFFSFGDYLLSCNERDAVLLKVLEKNDSYAIAPRRAYNGLASQRIRDVDICGDRFMLADGTCVRECWLENHELSCQIADTGASASQITACRYHPQEDQMVIFSTDAGIVSVKDERASIRGQTLNLEAGMGVLDFEVYKHEIYVRAQDEVVIFDTRNAQKPTERLHLSPKYTYNNRGSQDFRIGLLSHPRVWLTGYYGGFVQLGNQAGDVLQFKADRRSVHMEHSKAHVKASCVVRGGKYQMDNYQMNDFQGAVTACQFDYQRQIFAVSSGGNLLLYTWATAQ